MKRKSKAVMSAAALTSAALLGFTSEELYRYIFCRESSALFKKLFDSHGHDKAYYKFRLSNAHRLRSLPHDEYTIYSDEGQKLRGFYYPCGSEGKKIAVFLHGYRSDHADNSGVYYDYCSSRKIDMFCSDHRSHGESEGRFIGYDIFETEDSLKWLDFLIEKFGPDTEIFLHGSSMGAATVMQMSSRCPKNVKFIVEDSGYVNARASLWHMIHLWYYPMRLINRICAGYDIDDSDVKDSLSKSRIPMLFVHGQEDRLVPFMNGPALYEHYEGEKDYLFPENTRHIESIWTSPEEYYEKLDKFREKYM